MTYPQDPGANEHHRRRKLDTLVDLEAMLTQASERGATQALQKIGLGDPSAGADVAELREWMGNIRGIRKGVKETTVKIFTVGFWIILLGGIIQYIREHI